MRSAPIFLMIFMLLGCKNKATVVSAMNEGQYEKYLQDIDKGIDSIRIPTDVDSIKTHIAFVEAVERLTKSYEDKSNLNSFRIDFYNRDIRGKMHRDRFKVGYAVALQKILKLRYGKQIRVGVDDNIISIKCDALSDLANIDTINNRYSPQLKEVGFTAIYFLSNRLISNNDLQKNIKEHIGYGGSYYTVDYKLNTTYNREFYGKRIFDSVRYFEKYGN